MYFDVDQYERAMYGDEYYDKHICHRIQDCAYGYYRSGKSAFCQYSLLTGKLRGEPAGECTKFEPNSEEMTNEKRQILW